MYLIDINTVLANLQVFCNFNSYQDSKMVYRLDSKIMADEFQEKKLLDISEVIEKSININTSYPIYNNEDHHHYQLKLVLNTLSAHST